MISLHTIFLASLYFVAAILHPQCNNKLAKTKTTDAAIFKIIYSSTGGRSGNYENLDISADSLIYVQAQRGDEKTINGKTAKAFWNTLTNTINLDDFDKIKSNPGHALYDGIDITIVIERATKKHILVNGNEDTVNYNRIGPFTDLLEKKLAELRKKLIAEQ